MPVLLVMKYFGIFPPHSFLYRVSVVSRNVPTETFSQKSSPVCLISKKLLEVSFEHASLYPCERIILITDKHLRWYNLRKKWTLLELSKHSLLFCSVKLLFLFKFLKISLLFLAYHHTCFQCLNFVGALPIPVAVNRVILKRFQPHMSHFEIKYIVMLNLRRPNDIRYI